jgi:sulfatase modifying factor 1
LVALVHCNPLVRVQGGTYLPSSKLSKFEIGKYAVTLEEWQRIRELAHDVGFVMAEGSGGGPKHPVTEISWYDCLKWCNAKSTLEGLEPVYGIKGQCCYAVGDYGAMESDCIVFEAKANGYRLPTDAEWEWAAKGGRSAQGYTFAGSNDLNAVGWYSDNSGGVTHPIGKKAANDLGLHDMSGNVWEWCWDVNGTYRRMRGGCFSGPANFCAVNHRGLDDPDYRGPDCGLRLARSL